MSKSPCPEIIPAAASTIVERCRNGILNLDISSERSVRRIEYVSVRVHEPCAHVEVERDVYGRSWSWDRECSFNFNHEILIVFEFKRNPRGVFVHGSPNHYAVIHGRRIGRAAGHVVEIVAVPVSFPMSKVANGQLYSGICSRRQSVACEAHRRCVANVYDKRSGETYSGIVIVDRNEWNTAARVYSNSINVTFKLYVCENDNRAIDPDGVCAR